MIPVVKISQTVSLLRVTSVGMAAASIAVLFFLLPQSQ
jgi:hypothetical protein